MVGYKILLIQQFIYPVSLKHLAYIHLPKGQIWITSLVFSLRAENTDYSIQDEHHGPCTSIAAGAWSPCD